MRMIAAAISTPWFKNFVLGWFDLIFLAILVFGFWRGRKRGMSREFLPTLQWILIVVLGAIGYQFIGQELIQFGVIKTIFGRSVTETTAAFITAYLLIAFIIFIIFSFLKRRYAEKLAGGNTFGSYEYYLGMVAGVIRYLCIIFFALALLSAPYYSSADIAAQKAYNNRWYGGGLAGYSGDFIPSINEMQEGTFKDSFIGSFIKNNLGVMLIDTGKGVSAKKSAKTPVIQIGQ
jgi:uncharacterized membrane protein required for colicin V production